MATRQEQSSVSRIKIPQEACIHKTAIGNSHPLTAWPSEEEMEIGPVAAPIPHVSCKATGPEQNLCMVNASGRPDKASLGLRQNAKTNDNLLFCLFCVCRVCLLSNRIRREGRRLAGNWHTRTARKLLFTEVHRTVSERFPKARYY